MVTHAKKSYHRKWWAAPILVIALSGLLAAPALARQSPGKAEGEITYIAVGLERTSAFSMREASDGQASEGSLDYSDVAGTTYSVDIECVLMQDDTAYYAGTIVESSLASLIGRTLHGAVMDTGKKSEIPDRIWGALVTNDPCSGNLALVPPPPYEAIGGDVIVKSKDANG
jgi:hypothetical protein